MDFLQQSTLSCYQTIASLNDSHKIYLVQHRVTHKIYVKKILDVYNRDIYEYLYNNHINGTPKIIELSEENGQLFVIENYISGCSLQEKIDAFQLTAESVYKYVLELCTILEQMHSATPPIIHRDIKPSNIIITEHNHVILLDFNAAKHYTETTDTDTVLLGTKGYAAPEQYGFGASTPKTDIYALGILMKELVFALPSAPNNLGTIIKKCIQLNPEDRYQSITELKVALMRIMDSSSITSSPKLSIKTFLPPGFRTMTPWKMFISTFFYLFIFWCCLTLQVKNVYGAKLWLERFFCLLIMLSVIFECFNYLDIQRLFPLCKHRYKIVRYIGVTVFVLMTIFMLFIFMVLIESFLFM